MSLGRASSLAVIIESSIGLESAKRHAANHAVAGKPAAQMYPTALVLENPRSRNPSLENHII